MIGANTYRTSVTCSKCGRQVDYRIARYPWDTSYVEEFNKKYIGTGIVCNATYSNVACKNCNGTGIVTKAITCEHGKSGQHWYCEHGNDYTTNYHE